MLFCHFSYLDNPKATNLDEYRKIIGEHIFYINQYYQNIIKENNKHE